MSAAKKFYAEFKCDQLHSLYRDHISLTSAVGIDRISRSILEDRIDDEIKLISKKVHDGKYKFSQYREKLILKGANKCPRVISIPTFRDRLTLRALCNLLKQVFTENLSIKLPQHTIAEIRTALSRDEYQYFIKLDVINFYPTINHTELLRIIGRKIRKPEILKLICTAIECPTVPFPNKKQLGSSIGVPQGLSISNVLAEIYLSEFDEWARSKKNVAYYRYVDDILILTKENPDILAEQFRQRLQKKYFLETHEVSNAEDFGSSGKSMTGDIYEKFNFLGYEFNTRIATVKKESIRRLEASIAKILTTYKYRCDSASAESNPVKRDQALTKARKICLWRLNLRATGCIVDGVRKGWVFYFSQIDVDSICNLHHLDKTLHSLAQRFNLNLIKGEVKSFARTYHESKRGNRNQSYILNFDATDISYKREILAMYGFDDVGSWSERQIEYMFRRKIRRETSNLEIDIQGGSRG